MTNRLTLGILCIVSSLWIFGCGNPNISTNHINLATIDSKENSGVSELVCANVFTSEPKFFGTFRIGYVGEKYLFIFNRDSILRVLKADCSIKTVLDLNLISVERKESETQHILKKVADNVNKNLSSITDFGCMESGRCFAVKKLPKSSLFKSENWGETWQKIDLEKKNPERVILQDLVFTRFKNEESVWIYGQTFVEKRRKPSNPNSSKQFEEVPSLWKSENGSDFRKVKKVPDDSLRFETIFFSSANAGWAILSDGVYKFKQDKKDILWEKVEVDPEILVDSNRHIIQFIDKNTGWITYIGDGSIPSKLYKTDDGGKSWKKIFTFSIKMFPSNTGAQYTRTKFVSKKRGLAILNGRVYRTFDGGKNWKELKYFNKFMPIIDIVNTSPNIFYLINQKGNIYKVKENY